MAEMMQDISISGVCCGNSIVRAQKAIKAVTGVTGVRIDLARNLAQVCGDFNTETVIAALNAAGFPAGPMTNATADNKK